MQRTIRLALVLAALAVPAHSEAPTVVAPIFLGGDPRPSVSISLAALGIDSSNVRVTGALRGRLELDGDRVVYTPAGTFAQTSFDLFRIVGPRGTVKLNVAVVESESEGPEALVARAGAPEGTALGWTLAGQVAWDTGADSFLVTGPGELAFDFTRDGVVGQIVHDIHHGGQAGSGTSITLRPPPPPPPQPGQGLGEDDPLLFYRGGSGGSVWELWLHPDGLGYEVELVLTGETGLVERDTVAVPLAPSLDIELSTVLDAVVLDLPGRQAEHYDPPLAFSLDRTWHRFGNLAPGNAEAFELGDLRVERSGWDFARQVVAVDDFDSEEWAPIWSSPATGALRLTARRGGAGHPPGSRALVADLSRARLVGPDHLARTLEVPRVAMTCRFELDLSRLRRRLGASRGTTVFTVRDPAQPDPLREYGRLLVRRHGTAGEVRLGEAEAQHRSKTSWIRLSGTRATIEVQWRKTAVDEGRLDLWVDGCGPDPESCSSGWQLTGLDQPGLVTEVRFGALGSFEAVRGAVGFDNMACAGDSWVEADPGPGAFSRPTCGAGAC